MTRKQHALPAQHQGGFSLIELLVSIAIGLIIMVAAISAYVGSADASRMSDAQSRMNEDAQAALSIWSSCINAPYHLVENPDHTVTSRLSLNE